MGKRESRQNEGKVLEIDVGDERRGASSGRLVCPDYKQGRILGRILADGVKSPSKQVGSHSFFFGRQQHVLQLKGRSLGGQRPKP